MERNNALSYGRPVTAEKGKHTDGKPADEARLEGGRVDTPNIYIIYQYSAFLLN